MNGHGGILIISRINCERWKPNRQERKNLAKKSWKESKEPYIYCRVKCQCSPGRLTFKPYTPHCHFHLNYGVLVPCS